MEAEESRHTNFTTKSETFPCKNCGNEIRLVDAIEHASTCLQMPIFRLG